jgi:hypothetical protein
MQQHDRRSLKSGQACVNAGTVFIAFVYLAPWGIPLGRIDKGEVKLFISPHAMNDKGHLIFALQHSYVGVVLKSLLGDFVPLL